MQRELRRWRRVGDLLVPAALGFVLALVQLWPLVRRLNRVARDGIDPRFQAWTIDWVQGSLGAGWDAIWNANSFWPERNTLAFSDSLLGPAIVLLPLRWAGLEPIGVLNAGIVLAYASTFAAGMYFGTALTRSRCLGAVTGTVFAFGPVGSAISGHLHVAARAGIALIVLVVWWTAARARAGRPVPVVAVGAVTAALVFAQGTISVYQISAALLAAAAVSVVLWRDLWWRGIGALLGGAGVGFVALTPIVARYLDVRREHPEFRWTLASVEPLGARFLEVDPALVVWGSLLSAGRPQPTFEADAFPGVAVIVLALVGVAGGRRRRHPGSRVWACGLALSVAGTLFALGAGASGWRRWTPFGIAFRFVPLAGAVRAPGRLVIVALLGLGVLAALGVAVLADRFEDPRRARRILAAVALLAAFVEGARSWDVMAPTGTNGVDRALASRAGDGAVLYLPLPAAREEGGTSLWQQPELLYRSTAHRRPIPNGYAAFAPLSYEAFSRRMLDLPSAGAVACLRQLGVEYVVVTTAAVGTPWEHLLSNPPRLGPLRRVARFRREVLLEVTATEPRPYGHDRPPACVTVPSGPPGG